MSLLQSVNRMKLMLREDQIAAISAELQTQTLVDLLNMAADEHLNSHEWSFLVRHDAQAWFPALRTETTGALPVNNSTTLLLNQSAANSWDATDVSKFTAYSQTGRLLVRVKVTGGSTTPETSYPVDTLAATTGFPAVLRSEFRGDSTATATAGFELYSNEFALPTSVRRVLSVRHQETPIRLEFVDKGEGLDRHVPRVTDHSSSQAEVAYVGGLVTGTGATTADQATGLGLMIWPLPSADMLVDYSYVYRFAELSADADEWTGVPLEHVRLIESMAFEKALDSNIEDDPSRASRLRGKNEQTRTRLVNADHKAPVRRVPDELGLPRNLANPRRRWSSQTVPTP